MHTKQNNDSSYQTTKLRMAYFAFFFNTVSNVLNPSLPTFLHLLQQAFISEIPLLNLQVRHKQGGFISCKKHPNLKTTEATLWEPAASGEMSSQKLELVMAEWLAQSSPLENTLHSLKIIFCYTNIMSFQLVGHVKQEVL